MLEERRVGPARFRFSERRSGFDRRAPRGVLVTLRDHPSLLVGLLIVLNVLSAADWALSLHAFQVGAVEGNLILGTVLATSPVAAAAFKASVILAVSFALWTGRRYRLVLATSLAAVATFMLVGVYHLGALTVLGIL